MAHNYATRENVTKKELEVLVGHMYFTAKAIYGARLFTRLYIDMMTKLKRTKDHVRVTKHMALELNWWEPFAAKINHLARV